MDKKYYKGRHATEYDRKYDKETYRWCKEHKICVVCKKEKAEKGSVFCLACRIDKAEKARENYKHLSPENAKIKSDKMMSRYHRLKEQGICIKCGKRKAKSNSIFCSWCAEERAATAKQKRIENGGIPRELFGNGEYCAICGKPTENGKKLCNRCLNNSKQSIKIAQSNQPENNIFRQQNNDFWNEKRSKNEK